ncbi:MAG: response regulator [Ferruginibacter sp.]
MNEKQLTILLADDDTDDCLFFKDALEGMAISTEFTTVHNGEQLMELLNYETNKLPHVLFLDLNMPRKNGFECLAEIKQNKKLKGIPVVIFSTSYEQEVVNLLYRNGAQYFIRKPSEFGQFKKIILYVLTIVAQQNMLRTTKSDFVLTAESNLVM